MKRLYLSGNAVSLLIMDGLKAHQTDCVNKIFEENNNQIHVLPSHGTHLLQSLDLCKY